MAYNLKRIIKVLGAAARTALEKQVSEQTEAELHNALDTAAIR
jgi:hypothetical protein